MENNDPNLFGNGSDKVSVSSAFRRKVMGIDWRAII